MLGEQGVANGTRVRLKYGSGAIAGATLFVGAVAVTRNQAKIIGADGKEIPPVQVVICRKASKDVPQKPPRMGSPVEAIDPGPGHRMAVIPWGTDDTPMIAKELCRAVGTCRDTYYGCGNCCNNPKK